MIVSWNWLKQYVVLDMPVEELQRRLMMAGINHEGTEEIGGDLAIDLEVTSNRPDCLGHLGIAREVAVLFGHGLKVPAARPKEGKTAVEKLIGVTIECPDLCSRYTARVIRGVKVGPSPAWMVRRLATLGLAAINNVVDISNYVLMECGQPLHTFDYGKLAGPEIIVRRPRPGEKIEAIDHETYELGPETCVIADAKEPVAIGGVMGGASTEISERTKDVLIEAAEFNPISIRNTARQLNLHSDSSYRFERTVDPEGVDWASRRCCELILDLAGGQLAKGVIDVGRQPPRREPIVLRLAQLKRILGIDVPEDRVREILAALGNVECPRLEGADVEDHMRMVDFGVPTRSDAASPNPGPLPEGEGAEGPPPSPVPPNLKSPIPSFCVLPPSWRRDLSREIDLIEEVARIHGYDQIPEDVSVPMAASSRSDADRVYARVREVLCACGLDEAMTLSVVDEEAVGSFLPWSDAPPLRSLMPVLRGADRLRCSLVPSLLEARRTNEALSNPRIELFEIAKVYLPRSGQLPDEQPMLAISSGRTYAEIRGVIEAVLAAVRQAVEIEAAGAGCELLDPGASCRLLLGGEVLGYVGQVAPEALKRLGLRQGTTVAEVKMDLLVRAANLVPQYVPQPPYPAVARDLNLVVDEPVRWALVAATVRRECGDYFEGLEYRDTYRDPQRLGEGKKSLLMTISLRWSEGTMTSQEADGIRDRIVAACVKEHGAALRA
jgi:phenylalanyl-tRNA synthetase beta chain